MRLRRDPRSERVVVNSGTGKVRVSIRSTPAPLPIAPISEFRRASLNPEWSVLVVPDIQSGSLSGHDLDVFGAARFIADPHGAHVIALNSSRSEIDWSRAGADRVIDVSAMAADRYAPEMLAQAIATLIQRGGIRHVILPDTNTGGGDVGRRVAAALNEDVASAVVVIEEKTLMRSGDGGARYFRGPIPRIVLLAPEGADPVKQRYEASGLPMPEIPKEFRIVDRGLIAAAVESQPLAECDFILAGGLGISDWKAFRHLAFRLGAAIAGTRPVCDAGLLSRDRQVGASGVLVDPRCYVAFGISGAPQHLQGIAKCRHVVAVNTDPHADMLRRADLAIVADAGSVATAMLALLDSPLS